MKCDTSRELFSERIDGTLDPERSASLDQHLAQCSGCMAELTSLRLAVDAMRSEGRPQTSGDERAAIMAVIDREAEDRLVASAVAGETLERRSGVFKRAMLMPAPAVAKRSGLAWFTHVTSFAVGIAAAALFWFGSRETSQPTDTKVPTKPAITTANVPATPPIVAPAVSANELPPGTLMRVAGQVTVLHNGHESARGEPLRLNPGDTLEVTTASTWRMDVGKNGDLEVFSKEAEPAPVPPQRPVPPAPIISRGPLFSIDLDPAPLHRLADRVSSSLDKATHAFERAADAMPKPAPPAAHEPAIEPTATAAVEPTVVPAANDAPVAASADADATAPGKSLRSLVVVRTEADCLRLETSGSPLEVIPALVLRLRDDDAKVVALVTTRLELVREEYERDPMFPRVAPKDAPVEKSVLRQMADYVIPAGAPATVEDPHTYWARWFDTCADAIVARETFGTW